MNPSVLMLNTSAVLNFHFPELLKVPRPLHQRVGFHRVATTTEAKCELWKVCVTATNAARVDGALETPELQRQATCASLNSCSLQGPSNHSASNLGTRQPSLQPAKARSVDVSMVPDRSKLACSQTQPFCWSFGISTHCPHASKQWIQLLNSSPRPE